MTTFDVNNETDLNNAIDVIDTNSFPINYVIDITGPITLTSQIEAINLQSGATLTIQGTNGSGGAQIQTIDGANFSGFFVYSGDVTIQDLTLQNMKAQGGGGGNLAGGGAGLGGGLFVAGTNGSGGNNPSQAIVPVVTLVDVNFSGDQAVGGHGGSGNGGDLAGGGGGLDGGHGGNNNDLASGGAGGGGVGLGAAGGNFTGGVSAGSGGAGIIAGAASGGHGSSIFGGNGGASGGGGGASPVAAGGGVDGSIGTSGRAGSGGFGGGGGGSPNGSGGQGGFGGGGGAAGGAGGFGGGGGDSPGLHGVGGFGGGTPSNSYTALGGGGGLGAGGDIFVQQGGTLTIEGDGTLSGGSVTGGAGGDSPPANGRALGSGMFLQGNGTLTFALSTGQSESISDVITDQSGSGGTGANAGSWGLLFNGTGSLTLAAADSYSGGTTISAGTLQLGSGSNNGSINGDVSDDATFLDDDAGSNTLNGVISGSGIFKQIGTGTTILTGTDDVGGGTTIVAGTLQLGNGGTTGSLADLIADDGTLAIDHSDTVTWSTLILGSGAFAQIGAGSTIFTTAEGYLGGTTVANGTLQLGSGGSLASGGAVAVSGGTFDLGTATQTSGALTLTGGLIENGMLDSSAFGVQAGTVSAVLGGSGALTKTGSGTVTLSGTNSYGGGTTISAGTLQLGNGGTSGSFVGNVTDNATLAEDHSNTVTWTTTILGTGAFIQIGAGITIFNVAESYGGGTTVSNGTLQLGANGSLASSGAVAVSGGTFDLGTLIQTTGALSLTAGLIEDGTLDSSAFGVQAGAASAVFGGGGALTKTGSGIVTLSGANMYSGGTTIDAGTLQIAGSGTLGAATGLVTVSGGTLDLGATTQTAGPLSLTAGVIQDGRLDSAAFGVAAGTVSAVFAGSGALTKSGGGTVVLTAANIYSGGTVISGGMLQLGDGGSSGSLVGNATDDATFAVDRSDTYTFAGSVTGTGAFEQIGSGTTILTTSNSYGGGTTISAGVLQLGDGDGDGSITGSVIDGTVFNVDDLGTTTLGQISGGGSLSQIGSGTTILNAANSYTGGTTITAGTLQLGDGGNSGSLTGNITDNATLAVDRSDIFTLTESISGTGGFAQIGTGTTVLTAAQNYTGGTTVLAGTLQLGSGGGLPTDGNITVDGGLLDLAGYNQTIGALSGTGGFIALGSDTLTTGAADSTIFAGAIFGSGAFIKVGSGVLTLTGANNYTGGTAISAGTLALGSGGSITGEVTFADAGSSTTLQLDSGANQLGGGIGGFALNDTIDLRFLNFSAALSPVWQENGSNTGGTLSVHENGATLATLTLSGHYASANFSLASDGDNGAAIGFQNQATPSGSSADMIMEREADGTCEIYDIGNNTILAAYSLGQISTQLQIAGVGGFNGDDTSDLLMRNTISGALQVDDVSGNTITGSFVLGTVGLEWAVAGLGDFSSHAGETDMLMRNSINGDFEVYDIDNNAITFSGAMGQVGLEWQVAGFGDFSTRAGEADMLMRNSNTGALEVYDIANNAITSAGPMGQVGLEWQVAGFGDFSGNANETDMLMRNSNTGAFELYDISNNTITLATGMGQVGMEWTVAGFGHFSGNPNETDMLLRNSNTGAFELYDIRDNAITLATGMGQVGLEWSVGGVTAAPPAQLGQAMASFAPDEGVPVAGSPPGQQATLHVATGPLAQPSG